MEFRRNNTAGTKSIGAARARPSNKHWVRLIKEKLEILSRSKSAAQDECQQKEQQWQLNEENGFLQRKPPQDCPLSPCFLLLTFWIPFIYLFVGLFVFLEKLSFYLVYLYLAFLVVKVADNMFSCTWKHLSVASFLNTFC